MDSNKEFATAYDIMVKEYQEKLSAAEARIETMQSIIRSQNAEIIRLRDKYETIDTKVED